MFLDDVFDEELGLEASIHKKKKHKKHKKFGRRLKRGLKAIATGGMSEAARAAKKTKLGRKIMRGAAAVFTGGASEAIRAAKKKKLGRKVMRGAKSLISHEMRAKHYIDKIKSKPAGHCTCQNDLARTVAAKLVAELGPPLNEANRAIAKLELQRRATYEHQRLMNDADFKRKVLTFIAQKAANGNQSAKRTISCLRG